MKKICVMQPYFFPNEIYFRLAKAVDGFVFFDDVNFRTRSWISHNFICGSGGRRLRISVSLQAQSQNKLIKEIKLHQYADWRAKFLKTLTHEYAKAENFSKTYSWISECLFGFNGTSIADFNIHCLKELFLQLEIGCRVIRSSELEYDRSGDGQQKIISICHLLSPDVYLNMPGGKELYDPKAFRDQGFEPQFLSDQNCENTERLSILDSLFKGTTKLLNC